MAAETVAVTLPTDIARRRITANLRGPVLHILARLSPEVAALPHDRAYDMILGDCGLLARSLATFREHRAAFACVLVDRRDRPVRGDNQILACGRTLNQTIAMVVRSAAKRHFRQRLDPWRKARDGGESRFDTRPTPGWGGMLERVMGNMKPPPNHPPPPGPSAADRLYDAIRDYLLHDWQVPIIPQYARMNPDEVRALGSRILDFRDAAELATFLDGGESTAWPATLAEAAAEPAIPNAADSPLAVDNRARLGEMLTPDGRRLGMKAVVPILLAPEVAAALRAADPASLRRLCTSLSRTGAATVRLLAVDWGLPADRLTTFLAAAAEAMPPRTFERLFGPAADHALTYRIVTVARLSGLRPTSPPVAFAAFMRDLLARAGGKSDAG